MDEIIDNHILPSSFENYRKPFLATFDLECVEKLVHEQIGERTVKLGVQNLVSIAFATNLPNHQPVFYLRESSEVSKAYQMVEKFLFDVFKAHDLLLESLPSELKQAIKKIQEQVKNENFGKKKTRMYQFLRFLEKYTHLPVYGFNSSKVIW